MSLEEQINKDYVQSMKDRDLQKSSAISYLRAMIKQVKIDKRLERVEDNEVVGIIRKQIKQRQDSIEQFEKGNRVDLADRERLEIGVMKVYLPQELSVDDIRMIVAEIVGNYGEASVKDMGVIMKLAREKVAGRADGRLLGEIVKEQLTKV